MTAVALAVLAAFAIGIGGFFAGLVERAERSSSGLLPASLTAMAIGLPIAIATEAGPTAAQLAWGLLMGVMWATGIFALSRGIAEGRVVVVVPLAGVLSAAVPVVVGVLSGERPITIVWAGTAIGLLGLGPDRNRPRWQRATTGGLERGHGCDPRCHHRDRTTTSRP